ncbi:hypothetical protein HUJ04_003684 [Dendroctonus ponderosae]|nr:hypothetical protein HUJ04_003684 [Dendroctonus ponderosae]
MIDGTVWMQTGAPDVTNGIGTSPDECDAYSTRQASVNDVTCISLYSLDMANVGRKTRWTVVLISTWTIMQTAIHVFWVIYAYLLTVCRIRPTYYDIVFVYLTYFYKDACGPIELKRETLFLNRSVFGEEQFLDANSSNVLYHFLNETLHEAELPPQSPNVSRTELYLLLLFITDGAWMVTAIGMAVGELCNSRQKHLSILFYGPWLLCSVLVIFLDVVASVQYGLDLIYIHSFTTWLDFIGVPNSTAFLSFNAHPSSKVLPLMPTTVVVSLLGRLFLVWLTNVICFFAILFMAIPDFYRPKPGRRSSRSSSRIDGAMDLHSTETRIRNWQLFYGNVEASSTLSNESSRTVPGPSCSLAMWQAESGCRRWQLLIRRMAPLMQFIKGQLPWSYLGFEEPYYSKSSKGGYPRITESRNVTLTRF